MRAPGERGSLLIITLTLVIILGALAVAIGRHLSLEVRLTKARLARQRAELLARSGVWLAAELIRQDAGSPDWAGDGWAIPQAMTPDIGHRLLVTVRDEERSLPLNSASVEQLVRLTGLTTLAQSIVDAADEADPVEDQPGAAPPYFAKNARFESPEELLTLPEMEAESYEVLVSQTSPYVDPAAPVNLNTATEEVLRALGLSEAAIAAVIAYREGPDGPDAHAQDQPFDQAGPQVKSVLEGAGTTLGDEDWTILVSNAFGVSSTTFRVTADATVEDPPGRVRIEAVLRRAESPGDAPVIMAWRQS